MELTPHEQQRYARHISLPEVGAAGQLRLKAARVLIVGAGGLGSPVALYLAAAGVGHIGIIDDDVVDLTNLQRQIIHADGDRDAEAINRRTCRVRYGVGACGGQHEHECRGGTEEHRADRPAEGKHRRP